MRLKAYTEAWEKLEWGKHMEEKMMTVDLGGTPSPGLKNLFTAMAKAQAVTQTLLRKG